MCVWRFCEKVVQTYLWPLLICWLKCKVCQKSLDIKHMRVHIGQHILKNSDFGNATTCGFCGKSTCNVDLKNTSKKVGIKSFRVQSSWDYEINFNLKSAEKSTSKMLCCNRPIKCPFDGCSRCIWLYNLGKHYKEDHGSEDLPEHFIIRREGRFKA